MPRAGRLRADKGSGLRAQLSRALRPEERLSRGLARLAEDGARVTGRATRVVQVLHLPDAGHAVVEQTPLAVNPVLGDAERLPRVRRVEATTVVVDRADDELPSV